jgi:YidC/Oxa1 family membrane protein insertase
MAINDNTITKQDTQKRILMATLLSFAFFIAYDFLYIQPQQELKKQQEQSQQNNKQIAQDVVNKEKTTPQVVTKQGETNNAPVTSDIATSDIISTITTKNNIIEIDSLGRIAQITLLGSQYITEDSKQIKLFSQNQLRPLEIRYSNRTLNEQAFKTKVVASSKTLNATSGAVKLTLTQIISDVKSVRTMTIYPDGHYDLDVSVSNGEPYFITTGFRPDVIADMYADHGALLALNDGTLNIMEDGDFEKTTTFTGVQIASAFDRYYATVLYNTKTSMQISVMPDNQSNPQIFIHGKDNLKLSGYLGPKSYKELTALDPKLSQVIEYGWFTFIAKPMFSMLQYIHNYVGNWGWTIVLVTILIKIILYPLAHKGMVSMNRLKELAPKIKQIQEKYANDKQKASMHMMELYKKEGANPMGGCLPILLQIPVFFAIYRVLINAIELKGAQWILWIDDLAEMDPYFVLPILMGATMYLQQKITPNTLQDEMQKKMFQWLPVIFTFFFLWFPAGLTLYWFINNLFTIAQQYYINKVFEANKIKRHEEHLEHKNRKGK